MKKVLFGLLALSSIVMAKEIVPAPVIMVEPVTPVYVAPVVKEVPYLTLRLGGDIAPRYKQAGVNFEAGNVLEEYGYSGTLNKKDGKGFGWEVALEYMYPIEQVEGLELGLGVAYQRHAKAKGYNNEGWFNEEGTNYYEIWDQDTKSFDSIPVYVVGKYNFAEYTVAGYELKPYIKADLGYSFNNSRGSSSLNETYLEEGSSDWHTDSWGVSSDIKNGLYWGAGAGLEYADWTLDVMYKVNTAKIKGNIYSGNEVEATFNEKMDYSRVTVSLGYKFNL